MDKANKIIIILLAALLHLVLTVISQVFLFYVFFFWKLTFWESFLFFVGSLLPVLLDFFAVRRLLRGHSFSAPRNYVLNLFDAVFLLPDIAALSYIFRLMVLDNLIGSAVLILLCTVCVDAAYFAGRIKLSRRLRA